MTEIPAGVFAMRKAAGVFWFIGLVLSSAGLHGNDCPQLIGRWQAPYVLNVALSDGVAYIAQGGDGFRIVDISDPANPVDLAACEGIGTVRDVAVAGNFAYVAAEWAFRVFDISDPMHPVLKGQAPLYGYRHHMAAAYPYVYIASETTGLRVFDVSVPAAPVDVGGYSGPEYTCDVEVKGSVLYLADFFDEGLIVLDISTPSQPAKISNFTQLGNAACMALSGDYLVVGDYGNGLQIIDASNPEHLREVGYHRMGGFLSDVAVLGQWAYVATQYGWLSAVDLVDPQNPVERSYTTMAGSGLGIAVTNGMILAAEGDAGLELYSIDGCMTHRRPVTHP